MVRAIIQLNERYFNVKQNKEYKKIITAAAICCDLSV